MDDFRIKVGAELDKNVGKEIQDGLNKVTPKPIEVPFKIDFKNSKEIENEMKRIVSKLTNGKGSLSDFKINTSTIFDEDLGRRIEKLSAATIKYKNELGETVSELYKFNRIGTDTGSDGQEEAIMGWSKAMSTYRQNIEQVTKKEEALAKKQQASMMKQKELVEEMNLLKIKADKSGTILSQDNTKGFETASNNKNLDEMTHYLKLAKNEYSQLNALMEKDLPISGLENMKKNIGTMPIDIQNVETSFKKLQVQPEELRTRIDQLGNSFKSLESFKGAEADKVKQYNLLKGEITGVTKEVKSLIAVQQQQISLDDKNKFSSSITSWSNDNTKGAKLFRVELERIQRELVDADKTKFTALKKEFGSIQKQTEAMGKSGRTVFQELGNNFKKFASWYGIAGITTGAVRNIKQMVSTVVELDKSLVDLQQATGFTAEETGKLLNTYIDLGQELGATGTEVAQAADVWLRQGKSISETNELIRDSMVLSKVGQIESAQSTQYLTSAMKGYKLEVSEVLGVVDKLSAVDLESATSVGGLAEAMSRTATGANMAGIEMDKLLGMIAVVGEVTQKSMDSVGESFKTIFARMGNVKLGQFVDEDGNDITTEINDVEKILNKVDIKLRDSATSFRNFGDVLDDVGGSWSDFNEVEQNAIANTFAGVRQRENFNVLMENYGDSLKYAEISANSAGTAMDKFSAYEESVEAKTKTLQASLEELASDTLNSSVIKSFLDTSNVLVNVTDKVGIFNIALVALMTILNAKKGTFLLGFLDKLIVKMGFATGSAATLQFALSGMIPAIAILGTIALYDRLNTTLEEQKELTQALQSEYDEIQTKLESTNSEFDKTATRMDELNSIESLTFVEKQELEDLKETNRELQNSIDLLKTQSEYKNKELNDSIKKEYSKEYGTDSNVEKNIREAGTAWYDAGHYTGTGEGYVDYQIERLKALNEIKKSGIELTKDEQKEWDKIRKSLTDVGVDYQNYADKYTLDDDTKQSWLDMVDIINRAINPESSKGNDFDKVFNSARFKESKRDLEELAKAGKLDESVITSNTQYKKLMDETGLSAGEVVEQIKAIALESDNIDAGGVADLKEEVLSLSKSMDNLASTSSIISSVKKDFKETGKISYDNIKKISEIAPEIAAQYLAGLTTAQGVMDALSQLYKKDSQNYKNAMQEKLSTDSEFWKKVYNGLSGDLKTKVDAYQKDLGNFKSVADAKAKIEEDLINSSGKAWEQYSRHVADLNSGLLAGTADELKSEKFAKNIEKNNPKIKAWNDIIVELDKVSDGLIKDFDTSLLDGKTKTETKKDGDSEDSKQTIDWISRKLEVLKTTYDKIKQRATDILSTHIAQNKQLDKAKANLQSQITIQEKSYSAYMKQAKNVGLSASLVSKVQNGSMDITQYSDKTAKKIEEYKKWYDAAQSVKDTITDLQLEEKALNEQSIQNIVDDYERRVSHQNDLIAKREATISKKESKGGSASEKDYKYLINRQKKIASYLQEEYDKVNEKFQGLMDSGQIEVGKDEWYEYQKILGGIETELINCDIAINGFNDSIYRIDFEPFDKGIDKIDRLTSEIDMLASLSTEGSVEQLLLLQEGYQQSEIKARSLNEEIAKLNKQFASGEIENESLYTERLDELTSELYNSIKAMKSYNESIVSSMKARYDKEKKLIEQNKDTELDALEETHKAQMKAIEEETKAMKKLRETTIDALNEKLDKYKDEIDARKRILDLTEKEYAFQQKMAEHTETVSDYEIRIAELDKAAKSGDREAIAEKEKLEEELAKAKKSMAETQHDREVEMAKDAYDDKLSQYEKMMNKQIKDMENLYDAEEEALQNKKDSMQDYYDSEKDRIQDNYTSKMDSMELLYENEALLIQQAAELTRSQFSSALDEVYKLASANFMKLSAELDNNLKGTPSSNTGSSNSSSASSNYGGVSSVQRSTMNSIIKNASGTGKGTGELNKYIKGKYGTVLSYINMEQLSQVLGMQGYTRNNLRDEKKQEELLAKLKAAGFDRGGYVDASMVKKTGEDGFALVKHGEAILTVEQSKLFKEFVGNMKPLNNLAKLNNPNVSNINNNNSPIININLNGGTITPEAMPQFNKWKNDIVKEVGTQLISKINVR